MERSEAELDARVARLIDAYVARCAFREDRALADELRTEVRPALDAIRVADGDPSDTVAAREALAMVRALGRRLAALGATPTAAAALVAALEQEGGLGLRATFCAVVLDGYVAAREEVLRMELAASSARSLLPIVLAPRCLAMIVGGTDDVEAVRPALEGLGRMLLARDAASCVLHLAHPGAVDPELAAEVLAFDASARLVGAALVISGPSVEAAAAKEPTVRWAPTFDEAARVALAHVGYELRPIGSLRRWLGR